RRLQHLSLGLAGLRHPAHLAQRLGQAGQGEHAVVHLAHAATPAGASVDVITAPPRQASPSYSTTDCPGVTARCGRSKATWRAPESSTVTSQGSSGCR